MIQSGNCLSHLRVLRRAEFERIQRRTWVSTRMAAGLAMGSGRLEGETVPGFPIPGPTIGAFNRTTNVRLVIGDLALCFFICATHDQPQKGSTPLDKNRLPPDRAVKQLEKPFSCLGGRYSFHTCTVYTKEVLCQ